MVEDRVDDAPLCFHHVLAGEERGVALHGVTEETLVRADLADDIADGQELHVLAAHRFAGHLRTHPHGDGHVGAEAEADVVGVLAGEVVGMKDRQRRWIELDQHLGARYRERLACADVERHVCPSPACDAKAQRGEGLGLRIGSDPFFSVVSAELSQHDVGRDDRLDGLENAGAGVADLFGRAALRRFHGQAGHDLEHVVLHDVADGAGLLVHGAASLHAEVLGHGDLHAADEVAVPERLQKGVGEAEVEEVLHRLLAEVVVDAENGLLVEDRQERGIERDRRGEVAPERLLDDHAGAFGAAGAAELSGHDRKHARGDGQIVQRMFGTAECLAQAVEGVVVVVIAVDVLEQRKELGEGGVIDASAMFGEAGAGALA